MGVEREGKGASEKVKEGQKEEEEMWVDIEGAECVCGRRKETMEGVRGSGVCSSTTGLSSVSPCLPQKAAFTKRFTRQVFSALCSPAL